MGRVYLQLEHDTRALWPLSIAGKRRRNWRHARIVDLLAPQINGLLELEHFVKEFPNANHGALAVPLVRRRVPQREQPQTASVAGPKPDSANGAGSLPFRHIPLPSRSNGNARSPTEPATICSQV